MGPNAPSGPAAYDPRVNPTVSETFAVLGCRFVPGLLSPQLVLLYDDGGLRLVPQRNAFFNAELLRRDGLDPVLRGLASQAAQEVNPRVVDDVRDLAVRPGVPADPLARAVQRARDFGLPDYNRARQELGLEPARTFAEVTSDVRLRHDLRSAYGAVGRIDPLVGGLAEDHLPDSALGPFLTAIVAEQFGRLRRGDRFWYEHDPGLSREEVARVRGTTLADVIRRNTGARDVRDNVFFASEAVPPKPARADLPAQPSL